MSGGMQEFGSSGLKRWAGYIAEEFLTELRGQRGAQVYREMRDNSAVIGSCLVAIEMLIRPVSWTVEPFSQDAEDLRRAQFLEECLGDMSFTWADTIGEALTMLPYGYAPLEIVYKRRGGDVADPASRSRYTDNLVGWRKLALRAQETVCEWIFDDAGGVQGLVQQAVPDYTRRQIPIEKVLLFRPRAEKNNPEGRSILRSAYWSWYFAKKLAEIEAIGVARDLAGLPVGWIPVECFDADATPQNKAVYTAMEKIVRDVSRDEQEGLLLPLDYVPGTGNKRFDFTLLSAGGERQFDTDKIVRRYEERMAMTMLADFILMGHENVGSYALSSDKTSLLSVAIQGWLGILGDTFNGHGVPRLWRMNGWDPGRCARLVHGDVQAPNLGALGDFVGKVKTAGFDWSGDAGVDSQLRRVAGMPRRSGPLQQRQPVPEAPGDVPPAPAPLRADAERWAGATVAALRAWLR